MIGRLKGIILEKTPPCFILDIAGVGYVIHAPLSAFNKIEINQEATLYTKCLVKEEESFIYGFLTKEELSTFEQLISVPGVGPKLALNILSQFSPNEIARAIEEENLDLLSSVPKIGRKIASKIILELKGKLSFVEKTTVFNQAVNALCSLGLSRIEAINRVKSLPNHLSLEEMVKQALKP